MNPRLIIVSEDQNKSSCLCYVLHICSSTIFTYSLSFGRCLFLLHKDALKMAQVGCMRQVLRAGALGRPRGMGREAGEGIRMGNTCKSLADSCQCMAKTTTIL